MTDEEILESLKVYTCKPEVVDNAIKLKGAIEKIKAEIKYESEKVIYRDSYRQGFEDALEIIQIHTEGLL
jgi:hypothetical protein